MFVVIEIENTTGAFQQLAGLFSSYDKAEKWILTTGGATKAFYKGSFRGYKSEFGWYEILYAELIE